MAEGRSERSLAVPWTYRLFEVIQLAPAWTGLLIVTAWCFFEFLFAFSTGWIKSDQFWLDVPYKLYWAVMIGYLPTATTYSLRAGSRQLRQLHPALSCTDSEFEAQIHDLARFPRTQLATGIAFSIALAFVLPFAPGFWVGQTPAIGDPQLTWAWVRMLAFCSLVTRTLYIEFVTALRFSQIGKRFARIDLLELEQLAPFARRGLGSVLVVMGLVVLFSVQFAAPWQTLYINVASLVSFFGVAIAALVLPVLGVHRRIAEEKSEVLERIRKAIRGRGDPTQQLEDQHGDSRLPDLIAYKVLIDSVSTWPFDSPTLVRFGIFLSLGLGSWLGAAFVERLLDSALR